MAGWDSYTQKSTPADADTLMIKDTSGGANKRTPFSGVWNWILTKLTNAVISQLETTNKSIIPAINELNSKTFLAPGESIKLSFLSTIGFITNSGKNLYITIPCGKSLKNVSGFTISGENLNVRQNGLYVLGTSSSAGNFDDLTILSRTLIKGTGCLLIIVSSETPFENAVNNEVCSVYFNSGTITFS